MYRYFLAVDHGEDNWKLEEIGQPQDGIEKMMNGHAPGKWMILKEVRVVVSEESEEVESLEPEEGY